MSAGGWTINLTGKAISVYSVGNGGPSTTKIGTINNNECFVDGSFSTNPWEGNGVPVVIVKSDHNTEFGLLPDGTYNFVSFADYASNGTSWVAVNTLERKVQYDTKAYDRYGGYKDDVPAGSRVWLDRDCTAGSDNPNYVAVTKVVTASNEELDISGHVFIDLTCGDRWVTVGSILLRKA